MRFCCPFCNYAVSTEDSKRGFRVNCSSCGKSIVVPANRLDEGCIIGDFILKSRLGAGAIGVVYRAVQISLDREVALKILNPKSMTRKGINDFLREARAAAKLSHSNLVQSFAVGEDDGLIYMAMTYIRGETLRARMKREGKLPVDESLHIVQQVAEALYYAWEESHLIHRDVKPDNIMLTDGGIVKLTDLGLAMNQADWSADMEISGSPSYMSPEQFSGEKLDTRSDIYSLGITLYQMVTGDLPYKAETITALSQQHFEGKAVPANQINTLVPAKVSNLIKKMMAVKASDRYKNMEELLKAIWKLRQKTAPNRSLVPDVHTISIKRLDYEAQKESVVQKKLHPEKRIKKTNSGRLNSVIRFCFFFFPVLIIGTLTAAVFLDNAITLRNRTIINRIEAFERLAADPTIDAEQLQSEAESINSKISALSMRNAHLKQFMKDHIRVLLLDRQEKEAAENAVDSLALNDSEALRHELEQERKRINTMMQVELPTLRNQYLQEHEQNERLNLELRNMREELNRATEALKKHAVSQTEEIRDGIRKKYFQMVLKRKFSAADSYINAVSDERPLDQQWLSELRNTVKLCRKLYSILSKTEALTAGEPSMQDISPSYAYRIYLSSIDDKTPAEPQKKVQAAFQLIRNKPALALAEDPENPDLKAYIRILAAELQSAIKAAQDAEIQTVPDSILRRLNQLEGASDYAALKKMVQQAFPEK